VVAVMAECAKTAMKMDGGNRACPDKYANEFLGNFEKAELCVKRNNKSREGRLEEGGVTIEIPMSFPHRTLRRCRAAS
jgi:hypothetical protein